MDVQPSRGPGGGRTKEEYPTPPGLYAKLDAEFHFDFDPAPYPRPPGFDGLEVDWGKRAYVNPPYGREAAKFLAKGIREIAAGRTEVAVFLIFARTDTRAFHDLIMRSADEIRFIRGRLTFVGAETPAPYASMLVVFRPNPRGSVPVISSYDAGPGRASTLDLA